MNAFAVASLVLACLLAGAWLGFWFSTVLPEHHLSAHSKDSVKQSVAVLSTLTALVLGLVVGSAKSSYDAKGDALTAMAADIILLDRNLAQYGPETAEARKLLRDSTEAGIKAIWADDVVRFAALEYAGAGGALEGIQRQIRGLAPQNDAQRELKARAIEIAGDLSKTRWLALVRSGGTIPVPFLAVVVAVARADVHRPRAARRAQRHGRGGRARRRARGLGRDLSHPGARHALLGPDHAVRCPVAPGAPAPGTIAPARFGAAAPIYDSLRTRALGPGT